MSNNEKYNGRTNYETRNLALHIDNERYSREYWKQEAEAAWENAEAGQGFTHAENAAFALADTLKDAIEDNAPEIEMPFYSDVLNAAISQVNWYEIAKSMIENREEK